MALTAYHLLLGFLILHFQEFLRRNPLGIVQASPLCMLNHFTRPNLRFFLGDVGNGAAMKLVVSMIMGSMMASFSEGLLLSEKIGLDPSVLVEVVSQGAISAPKFR
ncbi:glyoxylate/succinic semialdehyde reductase 2, chloroplastic-like [Rhododendron vialii]|uniref:glyoxylate/succinic semialdehyde reductase 2, chloroplastic-like n=1 Tax=Rhododendron vialii TaxID=182163 RepID=UPI00265DE8B1|nr:glyoxylate/succinic semialdehyde reductase 2, chloroplastic-like [Rhododendron vialii]